MSMSPRPTLAPHASALALILSTTGFSTAPALAAGPGDRAAAADANPGATPVDPAVLYLRAGEFRLPERRDGLEALVTPAARAGDPDPAHLVIQLDGPMTPARRAALADAGVVLLDYLPANAFLARLDGADPARVAALDFIRWHGGYDPAWKVDPEVARRAFVTPERQALAAAGLSLLEVTLFERSSPEAAAAAVLALPDSRVHRTDTVGQNPVLAVTVRTADVAALAGIAQVQFIEEAPELTPRSNSNNRWVVQTNISGQTPFYAAGIHGEGQVVGVIDGRIEESHCSFDDSVPVGPGHRKILAFNASSGSASSHGTHVAGTVVGDSGVDNDLRGVAYMGRLVHNIIPASDESAIRTMLTTHHGQGARVHTNSWGNDGTTSYDGLCRGFDDFLWLNEDSMVTLAVSNQSTLRNPENAKNLLACGATQPVPDQAEHCFGGTGPTSDLRRKPEIYAPGCSTISAANGTACGTRSSSGTSMATPAVAGAAMLARQYYTDGYYPTGAPVAADAFVPSGALIKATLLNSTVDMTGTPGFPTNQEGWGRILLDNAVYFPGDARRTIADDVRNADGLSTGGLAESSFAVLSPSQGLSITLTWTEPPAAAGAALAAVNDLDLVVTAPDGAVYRGNVFTAGESAPGGARDARNNVEQVRLSAPIPGAWTARIEGAAVNQGAQGYALVVSGDIQDGPAGLLVNLAAPPPSLAAPGVPLTIDVNIDPGDDALIAGSALLAYRYDTGAPYTIVELGHEGGTLYRATIPGAYCGESPEFYIAAEGVASGVRTSPPGAPGSAYAYQVGVAEPAVLLDETFATIPAGWTASGLWHVQSACAVAPACDGPTWAAYNQDAACDYDTGGATTGTLASPPVAVPDVPGAAVTLEYCSTLETEGHAQFDTAIVRINGVQVDRAAESPDAWQTRAVDLTAYAGQSITLAFEFDSGDGQFNDTRGWQVDRIRLTGSTAACSGPCRVDVDGDMAVNSNDISAFLARWLTDVGGGPADADFDRDGTTTSNDISAYLAAWLAAIAGGC